MSAETTMRARDVLRRSGSLRPERLDIKLPPISDLMPSSALPTPPTSGEMGKRHSFSSEHDDDYAQRDHVVVSSYDPSDHSYRPLFPPMSTSMSSSRYSYSSPPPLFRRASPMDQMSLDKTLSAIASDFEYAIAQHSTDFRARHPTFHGPSIEDYHVVAAFTEQVHRRAPEDFQQRQSPQASPRRALRDMSSRWQGGRTLAPRPIYTTSPMSQHTTLPTPPIKRSQRVSVDPSPSKRARLDSAASFDDDEFAEPRKKRRSTTNSSRRRNSGAVSPKEAKHNRNRSTKEKKSTDYRDYPADIAPPFDTMRDPMNAAQQCPEHNVANPRSLSSDPLQDQLHESERTVAQKLNIDCAYFLCVKRQIFQRYLEHLQTKSFNWNKTAAQQCSNVDVGKTSQIFMFFQRVGWFSEELYKGKI